MTDSDSLDVGSTPTPLARKFAVRLGVRELRASRRDGSIP
jgi:hypothetical protein